MSLQQKKSWWHRYRSTPSPNSPILSVETLFPLLMFAALSLLALVFHFIRIQFSEAVDFSLDWNLFLSWIPLLIGFGAREISKRNDPLPVPIALLSFLWLVFFPNAPYMITDLVHLSVNYESDRTWHDAIMLFYYAQISLFNGLVSLYWMHGAWSRTYSRRVGTFLLFLSFPLGGFGVFLGRVLRLNSWDVLHNPQQFLADVADHIFDRTALLLIVEFGLLLGVLYAVLWGVLKFRPKSSPAR